MFNFYDKGMIARSDYSFNNQLLTFSFENN